MAGESVSSVLIVGGSVSGLATAFELEQRGVSAQILEARDNVGQRAETGTFSDGSTIDAGIDDFHASPPIVELIRKLGLSLVAKPAYSSIICDGLLRCAPDSQDQRRGSLFSAADLTCFGTWARIAASVTQQLDLAGGSVAVASPLPPLGSPLEWLVQLSFDSFVKRLSLRPAVVTWIRMTAESELGVEWHRVAALDGMAALRPFLVGSGTNRPTPKVIVSGGRHQLVRSLVQSLPPGAVRADCRVRRVVDHGPDVGVEIHSEDGRGRRSVTRSHLVVFAIPIWDLGEIEMEPIDPGVQAAIETTRQVSQVDVILRLDPKARECWRHYGEGLFPLLTDGLTGCLYLLGAASDKHLTLRVSLRGRWAEEVSGQHEQYIVNDTIVALGQLHARDHQDGPEILVFPGLSRWVTDAMVLDRRRACAHWPHSLGRSQFDPIAVGLRRQHGQVLFASDATEPTQSAGALQAAQRVASLVAFSDTSVSLRAPSC
jgi:monoamine oxidase